MTDQPYTEQVRALRPDLMKRFEQVCERYRREPDLRKGMELYQKPIAFESIEEVREEAQAA